MREIFLCGLEIFVMVAADVLLEVLIPHAPAKYFLAIQIGFSAGIIVFEGSNTGPGDRILAVVAGYFLAYAVVDMNAFQ